MIGNICTSNGSTNAAGVNVTGTDCHLEGNFILGNFLGFDVDGPGNLIVKNTASGNTTNHVIAVNNKVGVIVAAPNSAATSGATGGRGVGTPEPWANLSF